MTRRNAILAALGIGLAVVTVVFGGESLANDGFTLGGLAESLPYFLMMALWISVPFSSSPWRACRPSRPGWSDWC